MVCARLHDAGTASSTPRRCFAPPGRAARRSRRLAVEEDAAATRRGTASLISAGICSTAGTARRSRRLADGEDAAAGSCSTAGDSSREEGTGPPGRHPHSGPQRQATVRSCSTPCSTADGPQHILLGCDKSGGRIGLLSSKFVLDAVSVLHLLHLSKFCRHSPFV